MAAFAPYPGMSLALGATTFQFTPHPLFTGDMDEVYVIEGGEALVYQLQDLATGAFYALKVSKPSYRGAHIARAADALAPYQTLPGLSLAERVCLTEANYPEVIAAYPDLRYATLMPWLQGRTWSGFLQDRQAALQYGPERALALALLTAQTLWELEARHLAHTDVAGSNLALAYNLSRIELLDLERLYVPHAPVPPHRSLGTPGYQHRSLGPEGQWRPDGDRFAGAILLTEIIAWSDPQLRALTPEGTESLFAPDELQRLESPRWARARDVLWAICPPTLHLYDQAWASDDLSECPELGSWAFALLQR